MNRIWNTMKTRQVKIKKKDWTKQNKNRFAESRHNRIGRMRRHVRKPGQHPFTQSYKSNHSWGVIWTEKERRSRKKMRFHLQFKMKWCNFFLIVVKVTLEIVWSLFSSSRSLFLRRFSIRLRMCAYEVRASGKNCRWMTIFVWIFAGFYLASMACNIWKMKETKNKIHANRQRIRWTIAKYNSTQRSHQVGLRMWNVIENAKYKNHNDATLCVYVRARVFLSC